MREDALEFGKSSAEGREPTKHELKVAERVSAFKRGDIAEVWRIDARDKERRKWKSYHRSVRKARDEPYKAVCDCNHSKRSS